MLARDVMSTEVLSIASDATVFEAAQLLVNMRVSAMPVLDARGIMIGIVSEADLIRNTGAVAPLEHVDETYAEKAMAAAHTRVVTKVMSRNVVTAAEESTLREISDLMLGRGIKRIPIVRDGAVVGIVSRIDLLRALLSIGRDAFLQERPGPRQADRMLRDAVLVALRQHGWSQAVRADVVASQGTIHLWGLVANAGLVRTFIEVASGVPDVAGVQSHLHVASG
jgi:CBS-domain-containing membrane protein